MKTADPHPEKPRAERQKPFRKQVRDRWLGLSVDQRSRLTQLFLFGGLLTLAFIWPLSSLMAYALDRELHSHIVLIPFVSLWLLHIRFRELPPDYETSKGWSLLFLLAGGVALAAAWYFTGILSRNDRLGLFALSWICFLTATGFLFLGKRWMKAAAFPVAFLIFMIPLPDHWVAVLESASQTASAQATEWYFRLAGVSFLRDDNVFQLPGITIKVAQECSGIRSSWVLFITGLVAAVLFLKSPWRRAIFVALVIPLGVLRNGFRILVIGWLCVNVNPDMIDSDIHHRGGPIFFALSMIPLFLLLWWLRRRETRAERKRQEVPENVQQTTGAT